jgi:hypothetical protein
MANFPCLPHWCLILLTAMYGWGTQDTMGQATLFLGTTVSWSYCDKFNVSLTSNIVETVIRLLLSKICRLMGSDNFQWCNKMQDQQGGRSNKFLIGTTDAAHCVNPFLNFMWDHLKIEVSYTQDQIIPSPLGMKSYKTIEM